MIKRQTGFTPLERSSYHLNGIRKHIARMWLKSQPNFQTGFTLIELLVAMVMFVFVIVAASNVFTSLLTQFKQQSKIAETNVEGIIGLELLRVDIEHAGFGLPWVIPGTVIYAEVGVGNDGDVYNDSPGNPPRAILGGEGAGFNLSDELIIKATNIARSDTAQRWTWLRVGNIKRIWLSDDFVGTDNVIVISPGSTNANSRTLVVDSAVATNWDTTYSATSNFAPGSMNNTNLIYGIDPDTPLLMPFNRADYYISTANVPARCAAGTGVLIKSVIEQGTGDRGGGLPLLDCVADMQVVYLLDTGAFAPASFTSALTAGQIRDQVRQVRVYILAHEGQRDPDFTYDATNNPVTVGPPTGEGRPFDLTSDFTTPNPYWQDYRWKVYTLVQIPNNLE